MGRVLGSLDRLPLAGRPLELPTLARDARSDLRSLAVSVALHPLAEIQRRIAKAQARLARLMAPEDRRRLRDPLADLLPRPADVGERVDHDG